LDNGGGLLIFATVLFNQKQEIMSVAAQEKLTTGSFILSTTNEGELKKGRMYRAKSVKGEGKYVILDTDFCGTDVLKAKIITFDGRFRLMNEDEVKQTFKELLTEKGFTVGQEFNDVRTGEKVVITPTSRTHILPKFGKLLSVKVAGGHVWFAGKKWAEGQVDTAVLPEEDKKEKALESLPVVPYAVHVDTKERAVEFCNVLGGQSGKPEYWDAYESATVYTVHQGKITGYAYLNWASEEKMTIVSYEDWHAITFPAPKEKEEVKPKNKIKLTVGTIEEQILAVVNEHLESDEARKCMAESVESLLNLCGS
jgi:hypothetical protein